MGLLNYAEQVASALVAWGLGREDLLPLLEGFPQLERIRATVEDAGQRELVVQHQQQWLQLKLALAVTDQAGDTDQAARKRHALRQLASQLLRPWLTRGLRSQDDVRYYQEFLQAIVSYTHSTSRER